MKNIGFKKNKDEELVALYVSTQKNLYFEEIYERYSNKVYQKCYSFVYNRQLAEDLTHDIFMKLIVKIGSFKESSKFSTWLFSITYNYCLDYIRVTKKKSEAELYEYADFDTDDEDDKDLLEWQEAELTNSMRQMSDQDRILLEMKYLENFSIREISETMKISESAVKMRLLRSKEKLKQIYLEKIAVLGLLLIKIINMFQN